MADINDVYALLHVHESLQKHGDMFPNLKAHVLSQLRQVEADHASQQAEAEEPAEEEPPVQEKEPE